MSGVRRVIVGASGSPGSLRALRYAEELARAHDATLIPVLTWLPPGGDLADRRYPCGEMRRVWQEDACERLRDALIAVWGEVPADPPVHPLVHRGEAGWILVSLADCPGDLLVVGAGRRGALARMVGGKVSRYCLAHAECPVLAVPPPALAREVRHGPLVWAFWHRTLTPDRVLGDQGRAAALGVAARRCMVSRFTQGTKV
jgi:nucleotide-binding universal stress UspA family protein